MRRPRLSAARERSLRRSPRVSVTAPRLRAATKHRSPRPRGATPRPAQRRRRGPGRQRLRLDDILKLMVADGAGSCRRGRAARALAHASVRASARAHRRPAAGSRRKPPHKTLTLEWLVEWLAGKLGVPYLHIDPLKIDLAAVTADDVQRVRRALSASCPSRSTATTLTVATGEPFVRAWADELEKILKLDVKFVFANPADIKRYLGEFFNLARSMKKAQETSPRASSRSRATSSSWSSSASTAHLDANDQHIVHIVDWLWQYAFEQRASDIHIEPRRDVGPRALPHRRRAAPGLRDPAAGADRDDVAHQAARADGDRREAPPAGRPHQDAVARRRGGRAAHLDDADGVRREARHADLHARKCWCATSPSSASRRTTASAGSR